MSIIFQIFYNNFHIFKIQLPIVLNHERDIYIILFSSSFKDHNRRSARKPEMLGLKESRRETVLLR